MPREDRMRSLALLDKETVKRGEGDPAGIGAELFGMNLMHVEEQEEKEAGYQKEGLPAPASGRLETDMPALPPQKEAAVHSEPSVPKVSGTDGGIPGGPEQSIKESGPPGRDLAGAAQIQEEIPKTMPQGDTGHPADCREVRESAEAPYSHMVGEGTSLCRNQEIRPEFSSPTEYMEQPETAFYGQQVRGTGPQEPQKPYHYPKLPQPEPSRKNIARRIISVYSPKGGVGKSTISKELATAFSTNTVYGSQLKVLIMDADWEFGDVSTLFNVSPRPNVSDWIRDMMADKRHSGHLHLYTSREIETRYIVPYTSNLHILAGPGDPAEAELITEEMVLAIMESLRRTDYDIIIIDSANSNRSRTLVPLMKSDAVVLIETLDTSTVAETTAVLNALRSKQFDFNKLYMALNQVPDNDSQIDLSVSEISRLLQLDIAAVIPRYEMMRIINNAGEAAVQKKSTPYSKAIIQLANRIVPLFEKKERKPLFGFLRLRKRGN